MDIEVDPDRARSPSRQQQALRAAWLYYVAGRTQDEIAVQLAISRQSAQRLVSRAVADKLIRFRFDHPLAACMELGERLTERFGLRYCAVVPTLQAVGDVHAAIAIAGAQYLEHWFAQRPPLVIGFSTGRTLRAIAGEMAPIEAPQHKVLSVCGTIAWNGRAGWYEPVMRIVERTGAQFFPMPMPVVVETLAERDLVQTQRPYRILSELALEARCLMVGIGHIGWQAPLHLGGFITDSELTALIEAGAVGEIGGRSYDAAGQFIEHPVNARVITLPLADLAGCVRVGVGGGPAKVAAIRGALTGALVNGLITDEATAGLVLGDT